MDNCKEADMDTTSFRATAAPLPTPIVPLAADGGLGYDDILRIPDKLIVVQVGPWDGFEDGDTVNILVGPDQRIFGTAPASADDKFKVVTVLVPARNFSFLPDGVHDIVAMVTNNLGIDISSDPAPVRLKLAVPGGRDPKADTPYLNENLVAPEVDPLVIGPDTSSATVTIAPWDNKTEGDRLVLRWGVAGNELVHEVLAGEQGQPYTFAVDRAIIDQGGFGSGVNVNYQVFDIVENWSLWSPPTLIEAEDPDALDPPWVDPTVDDEGKVIDASSSRCTAPPPAARRWAMRPSATSVREPPSRCASSCPPRRSSP
jgi:hypothetical protein